MVYKSYNNYTENLRKKLTAHRLCTQVYNLFTSNKVGMDTGGNHMNIMHPYVQNISFYMQNCMNQINEFRKDVV